MLEKVQKKKRFVTLYALKPSLQLINFTHQTEAKRTNNKLSQLIKVHS